MDVDREPLALTSLPEEIILQILAISAVKDIYSVRCTCSRLHNITQQKILWITLLRDTVASYPVPRDLLTKGADDPEKVWRHYAGVARTWLRTRSQGPINMLRDHNASKEPLLGLELFLDQWLLIVKASTVEVWHTSLREVGTQSVSRRTAVLSFAESVRWTSYAAAVENEQSLVVVLTNGGQNVERNSEVFRVPLRIPMYNVRPTSSFLSVPNYPLQKTAQAVDPSARQIAFSRPGAVDLVRYPDASVTYVRYASISTEREDLEELWNGIVAIRFVREHVLIVRARSVQVYRNPLYDAAPPPNNRDHPEAPPCVQHFFPGHSFRQVSVSAVTPRPGEPAIYRVQLLANEVLQGLFLFEITLVFPAGARSTLPFLDVRLCGVYALSMNAASQTQSDRYSMKPRLAAFMRLAAPEMMQGQTADNRYQTVSARGFVSAFALGPQARRGIWVERRRGSTLREIFAWDWRKCMSVVVPSPYGGGQIAEERGGPVAAGNPFGAPVGQTRRGAGTGVMPNGGRGAAPNAGRGAVPIAGRGAMPMTNAGRGAAPNTGRGALPYSGRGLMVNDGRSPVPNVGMGGTPSVVERPRDMTGMGVYTRESYDLRAHDDAREALLERGAAVLPRPYYSSDADSQEDITHCTFSETEGYIYFGTRAGAVFMLTPAARIQPAR